MPGQKVYLDFHASSEVGTLKNNGEADENKITFTSDQDPHSSRGE